MLKSDQFLLPHSIYEHKALDVYFTMLETTEIAKNNNKKKTIQNETLVIADLILMSAIVYWQHFWCKF